MKDLFNFKFITSVAHSLLGCGPMQFGFPSVLHHIPEDQNFCHRTVKRGDIYICVCVCVCVCVCARAHVGVHVCMLCTWKIQEMPTKFFVRSLAKKTKTYMGG